MEKGFHNKQWKMAAAVFSGLTLVTLPVVCQASDYNDVDQVLENKVYIVGSIADRNEVQQTLETLKLSGMTGAFVIDAEELKLYPQTVQLITRQGHKIILRMKKQAKATAVQTDKAATASKPQAKPVQVPVAKPAESGKTVAKSNPAPTKKNIPVAEVVEPAKESGTGSHFLDKLPANAQVKEVKLPVTAVSKAEQEPEKPNQAMKVVDNQTNTKVKIENKPLSKKQRLDRDFFGVDENGRKIGLRYPGTAKNVHDVPDWSIASLLTLSDYGLLSPDDVREILSEPDRELMAKMTARAYHLCEEREGNNNYNARFELDKLLKEYDTELRNLGYGAGDYAAYGHLPQKRETKIGGELRYNYVEHSGDDPYNFRDSRLRLRLYVEQPLDENWTVYGMGEANKSWIDKTLRKFNLERLYIGGKYKDVYVKAGRFGKLYADGNVYDGRMTGASLSTGKAVKLTADYGELRDKQKGGAIVASYSEPRYDAEAGIYNFDNVKGYGNTTIGSLGGMYYIGNFGVGAMYLYSSVDDVNGESSGYIVTVKYGRNRSWVPGTYEIFAKYYDQADSTYIAHTMVGLADYMHGFKGFGVGMYYTLAENWLYGIEYYDLKAKGTGLRGRTLWNHVSYFF